ncbi:hypothetical protein NGUA31_03443 [Salmonella enterica]|nr:hypothetical protein NGUA06_03983 [Salmonella enterica]GAR30722.1 hypothetical protein NGUA08_03607 [Salmonella enterica]GAR48112.1 hypothetical protein NGUA12_02933 [Salmonella enterica]GAR67877.1 hypothetical protein NGUA17_00034 [Salmonella enterica]GAR77403.1 hypothetical protein NGUA19_00379 [Salmonella enterica]
MSDFEFTDDPGADEVFVPTQVEFPSIEVYATCDNVDVLTSRIVMKYIATNMSITESHPFHVVVSYGYPLVIR